MRPVSLAVLPIALSAALALGLAASPAWSDAWVDPGAVTEAICDVSHVGEDHSGESANGFTFDGVPFLSSDLSRVGFKGASLLCIDDGLPPDDPGAWSCDGRCADFSTADLEGADFTESMASGASFVSVRAPGATFSSATLAGARLIAADLTSSIWDGVDASGADLSEADLSDAWGRSDFDATIFAGARLRGATLDRVDFGSSGGATTPRTSFVDADLRQSLADCRYEEVEVEDAEGKKTTETVVSDCPDFTYALFDGADLRGVVWRGADLGGASFAGADTRLRGARLVGVDLTGGGSAATRFDGADLDGVILRDATFVDASGTVAARFDGASLEGADLAGGLFCQPLELVDANMDGDVCDEVAATPTACVDLTGAGAGVSPIVGLSLDDASLFDAWAPGIAWAGLSLRGVDLQRADLRCAGLEGADLRDAFVDGLDLGGARLVDPAAMPLDPADLRRVAGGCVYPEQIDDEIPQPRCPRFDGAEATGVTFSSAILDGATFVGAELAGSDFSFVQSRCGLFEVDPDLNEGLDARLFCIDFTGANLGPDGDDVAATFEGAAPLAAPVFESVQADRLVLHRVVTQCRDGELPGEDGGDPVSHRFCPRFEDATITRADFTEAVFDEAEFGCLEHDGIEAPTWDCTDLRGADFGGASLFASSWRGPVDLRDFQAERTSFVNADLTQATITCQGFTFTEGTDPAIKAEVRCPDFTDAEMTPGLDLTGASLLGVDLSGVDLTGVGLSGAELGCFEFSYDDEDGDEQSLPPVCTQLAMAVLDGADLSGAEVVDVSLAGLSIVGGDLGGVDLRGVDLTNAILTDAVLEDVEADGTTLFGGADLSGAGFSGADLDGASFVGALLDGADLSETSLRGVDLSGVSLVGATIHDAKLYGDTQLDGADLSGADLEGLDLNGADLLGVLLVGADLSGTDLRNVDLSGSSLAGARLDGALVDERTRFASDYVPAPGTTADEKKDGCTTAGTPVDVRGASLLGVDFRKVIDFGGACIVYDIDTTYDEQTLGLTDDQKRTMRFVPEPGALAAQAAALLTLAGLARRARRR